MAINIVSRARWGARAPRQALSGLSTARGVKIHYVGSAVTPVPADRCATGCRDKVRAIQRQHMDGNGWSDIGYNLLVCEHGVVWEGRGANKLPAANGAGLNSGHFAVCALLGTKGLVQPTDAMLHGLVDAIEYLRARGAGREVKGHRDGYATDCPGEPLYAWVRRGAPRPGGAAPVVEKTWLEALVSELPMLRKGSKGYDVKTVFYLLAARGYPLGAGLDDTTFGDAMARRVREFQKAKKLDDDGIVGPLTWAALIRP